MYIVQVIFMSIWTLVHINLFLPFLLSLSYTNLLSFPKQSKFDPFRFPSFKALNDYNNIKKDNVVWWTAKYILNMFNESDDDYLTRNHKHLKEMNIKIIIHVIFYITIVIIIYKSLYISYLLLYLINIIYISMVP
jgi:hypothetical protein